MYSELLIELLDTPSKELQIKADGVTSSAIRSGLNTALKVLNQQRNLLEIPLHKGKISVSLPNSNGITTIKLTTASPSKFSFTIVPQDEAGDTNE